jgi:hypothetical protein
VIAVYIVTKNMTSEQHTKERDRLREAGASFRSSMSGRAGRPSTTS